MLKSLTLRADGLPISGMGYEDIPVQSTRMEGFDASGRTVFRESYLNTAAMELAINSGAAEQLKADSVAWGKYQADQKQFMMMNRMTGAGIQDQGPKPESYLPRYGPEDLEAMGFTIHEGIKFDDDGKLSLPRYAIRAEAYEANQADAAIVGAMAPGIGSWAAGMAGGLAYSLADPINVIPFGAGISSAKKAYQVGKVSKTAIMGQAVKAGAIEGAAGAAAVDALSFSDANDWGAELGWKEALADVAVSGLMGSFFGALGGGLEMHSYRMAEKHSEANRKGIGDLEDGRSPDVAEVLTPIIDEARLKFEEKLATPEYVKGLMVGEDRRVAADGDAFAAQLEALDSGDLRTSRKFSRAPKGPDGPRLIIGESPAVYRMLDGFGWLEMSPTLAQKIKLSDEWNGFDPRQLAGALSRPAAVFEMGDGTRLALLAVIDKAGQTVAAVAELRRGMREFYSAQKKSGKNAPDGGVPKAAEPRAADAYIEVSDIDFIDSVDLSSGGLSRRILKDGKAVYADAGQMAKAANMPPELADALVYNRPDVLTPDNVARQLAKEDLGIDIDGLMAEPVARRYDPETKTFVEEKMDAPSAEARAEAAAVREAGENLAARAREDPAKLAAARELEIELAEQRLEEMAGRGELSDEEVDFLHNGNQGENSAGGADAEDAILGREAEARLITEGEAMRDATECALGQWGILDGVN